jgi:hypothetical protein
MIALIVKRGTDVRHSAALPARDLAACAKERDVGFLSSKGVVNAEARFHPP